VNVARVPGPELVSIVVPVYNEAGNLRGLCDRLAKTLAETGAAYEIVFVDDNSIDDTSERLAGLCAADARIKSLTLSRNFGHQGAVTCGIDYCRGTAVILMDGDLQDPPELVKTFIEKWRQGWDVVYTTKTNRDDSLVRKLCFGLFHRLLRRFSNINIPVNGGHFCLMDRKVVNALRAMRERSRYLVGMRSYVGFKQIGVEFSRPARAAGQPQQTFVKLIGLALDAFFSFSYLPLRMASLLGFAMSVASLIGVVYVLAEKLFTNRALLGWTSVMTLILLLGGIQLITIGISGEYIGRIYDEIKHRPIYVVAQSTGFDATEAPPRD
jgi:dolichol-phosphate mannosyltransferase